MLTACFFDLDGTLLPMDQEVFVKSYLSRLANCMVRHGYDPETLVKAVWAGTSAMVRNDGSQTNQTVFWNVVDELFGRDTRADEPLFEQFYREEFQQVRRDCGCNPKASETIRKLRGKGIRIVLATNPLFPPIATRSRVRWAGLDPADFEYITTYDNSSYCKPNPDYYREILRKLGLRGEECLMVGNDVAEDMIAEALGMRVFLLTDCLINREEADISRYPRGGFPELMAYLEKTS